MLNEYPDAYWTNQYDNPDNPLYHEVHTASEFLDIQADMIIGSVSTGGHFCGICNGLRKAKHAIRYMACDVDGSAIFGKPFKPYLLNGLGLSWCAENTDLSCFDYLNNVSDQNAISLCRLLARDTGLLLGGSSGVVIFSALMALYLDDVKSVVAIAPDSGVNYLEQFYDDEWLEEKNVKLLSEGELRKQIILNHISFDESLAEYQ